MKTTIPFSTAFFLLLLVGASCSPSVPPVEPATTPSSASSSSSLSVLATNAIHQVEELFVQDCWEQGLQEERSYPYGYYGAFFQPCTFSFFQSLESSYVHGIRNDGIPANAVNCAEETARLLSQPVPMHWFFNLTEHFTKGDWDELSSDDLPQLADDLFLWPDQCVGVAPQCYDLNAPDTAIIRQALERLFNRDGSSNGIVPPPEATHIRVDCRNDAAALSQVVYVVADGVDRAIPIVMAGLAKCMIILLALCLVIVFACFRCCCNGGSRPYHPSYHVVLPPDQDKHHDMTKTSDEYDRFDTAKTDYRHGRETAYGIIADNDY